MLQLSACALTTAVSSGLDPVTTNLDHLPLEEIAPSEDAVESDFPDLTLNNASTDEYSDSSDLAGELGFGEGRCGEIARELFLMSYVEVWTGLYYADRDPDLSVSSTESFQIMRFANVEGATAAVELNADWAENCAKTPSVGEAVTLIPSVPSIRGALTAESEAAIAEPDEPQVFWSTAYQRGNLLFTSTSTGSADQSREMVRLLVREYERAAS